MFLGPIPTPPFPLPMKGQMGWSFGALPETGAVFVFICWIPRSHLFHCIIPESHVGIFIVGITPDTTD